MELLNTISKKQNQIKINDQKLIFYHFLFQIFKNNKFYRLGETYTEIKKEPSLIYEVYERDYQFNNYIRKFDTNFGYGINKKI